VEGTVYRTTLCNSCGKELHSCLNCRHYNKGKPYDCSESIQEPVTQKDRANFCDYFQINLQSSREDKDRSGKNFVAKDDFNALFGE
jgi:hypothetical protein